MLTFAAPAQNFPDYSLKIDRVILEQFDLQFKRINLRMQAFDRQRNPVNISLKSGQGNESVPVEDQDRGNDNKNGNKYYIKQSSVTVTPLSQINPLYQF